MAAKRTYFQHVDLVLARVSTDPGGLDIPEAVSAGTGDAVGAGRAWLVRLWHRAEVRAALRIASPVLAEQIDQLTSGGDGDPRQVRRVLAATSSYLLRWRRRATPFGLFAGVAAASADAPASARVDPECRVSAQTDARWLGEIIAGLQQRHDLLPRLTVVANNVAFRRGARLVIPARPDETQPQRGAALDTSIRHTRAVAAALDGAAYPVRIAELAERIRAEFPAADRETISRLLAQLIDGGALITTLRPPLTAADPLSHVLAELDAAGIDDLPDLVKMVAELTAIRDELAAVRAWGPMAEHAVALEQTEDRMRAVHPTAGRVQAVDVAVAGKLTVPEAVLREAEVAATTLLRLTPFPFGDPAWKDWHARFLDCYGAGAVVGVREVVADSGLGFPAGFLGAARPHAAHLATERDVGLLRLIQRASTENRAEIVVTESVLEDLRVGDHAKLVAPARAELAFQLHAASSEALERGHFQLWVTGAPMHATSMAGRFTRLLSTQDRERLVGSYTPDRGDVICAQLSFPPRRERNENITRVPRLLPYLISLGEHHAEDPTVIALDDLAVTADADEIALVRISTGQRVQPHIPHALQNTIQTPPLARFLAEVASARRAVYGPFGYGVADDLPFVPRIRHGRAVLSPARWHLTPTDLRPATTGTSSWDDALHSWRARWQVPSAVVLVEGELRLALDLDDHADRVLLRRRLERTRSGRLELREAGPHESDGWAGRPCELVVPLRAAPPENTPRRTDTRAARPCVAVCRSDTTMPGRTGIIRALLHAHPARFDEILTDYLPSLLAGVSSEHGAAPWWFWRHHDPARADSDQHLVLCLRTGTDTHDAVAARLTAWAATVREAGLLAALTYASATPAPAVLGHHPDTRHALDEVFTADSVAAVEQLRCAKRAGAPSQSLAAASMTAIAASLAHSPDLGLCNLVNMLPHEPGKLDRAIAASALDLVGDHGQPQLEPLPGGQAVTEAWSQRHRALTAYRGHAMHDESVEEQLVLRTLLHSHHLRAVSVDPGTEKVTDRLARAVAQRRLALLRQDRT
ncbi:thiopeptide-type bacteriocin biosynthesis domain [Saccharomonospora marina XMU15]|uniref:Thiopeptide-type bacteriocin biosynthesis domain n=1 Tax=Saccharomonospora marina XMU15 TaxID=882083 RepID=H5X6W8_9PSEU|nr:lantibiotic dehydratase [Saccharomonospora marina]EHR52397.1 thiopeptide-type bacteriocin biosynthesis domain [Saccharomonospora marina XMU15]